MTANVPTPPPSNPAPSLRPVEELQALSDAATPGPWFVIEPPFIGAGMVPYIYAGSADPNAGHFVADLDNMGGEAPQNPHADAEFIAAARDALPALLARLTAVGELHRPRTLDVCMDEDEHDGSSCDCGTRQTVCAGCYEVFADVIGPWTDNPIPAEIVWPCPTAAALGEEGRAGADKPRQCAHDSHLRLDDNSWVGQRTGDGSGWEPCSTPDALR